MIVYNIIATTPYCRTIEETPLRLVLVEEYSMFGQFKQYITAFQRQHEVELYQPHFFPSKESKEKAMEDLHQRLIHAKRQNKWRWQKCEIQQ